MKKNFVTSSIIDQVSCIQCVLTVLALLALSLPISNTISSVAYGSAMVTHEIQSAAIARNIMGIPSLRRVLVYLPDDYENGNQRYPVIYWICGWGDTATGGEAASDKYRQPLDDAIKIGKIPPTIAVFLDGGMTYFNSAEFGNWEDFLISELIPFIDNTYRTFPDKSKRAIMGHSMGAYSAMMLTLLHPNIWGALGSNDGCSSTIYFELHIGKEEEVPDSIKWLVSWLQNVWKNMPAKLEDYKNQNDYDIAINMQLGVTISPNPAVPLHFDVPVNREGKVVPDVLEKWREYCLMDPKTIAKHHATLNNLSMISIIVPEGEQTNRYPNILMIDMLEAEGISVTRLDMPGEHNDFRGERFIALAESILASMDLVSSVNSKNKLSVTWGRIKIGN
jgi:pimeloyl-ACP methyl ester carboxylesterase